MELQGGIYCVFSVFKVLGENIMKFMKNKTFCLFKESFYPLAESARTSVFLFLSSFIFFAKEEDILSLAFGVLIFIMGLLYMILKFIDNIEKILTMKKQTHQFFFFILLLFFAIGLFSAGIIIAVHQVIPFINAL